MKIRALFTSMLLLLFAMVSINAFAAVKQERNINPFSKIRVGSAFKVYLTQGNNQSVVVEIDDEYVDDVKTTVHNGTLAIALNGKSRKGESRNIRTMNVYITTPSIEALDISGAAKVEIETPISTSGILLFNISGAATIKEATVKCKSLNIHMSGAGKCKLTITADTVDANVSGAAKLDLAGNANQLKVSATGASKVDVLDLTYDKIDISKTTAASVLGYK